MLLNSHSSRKLSEKVLHTPLSARPTAVCYRFVAGKAHLLSHASVNPPLLQVALSVLQATSYTWLAEGGLRTHRHSFLFTPQNHYKHSICKSKNLTWRLTWHRWPHVHFSGAQKQLWDSKIADNSKELSWTGLKVMMVVRIDVRCSKLVFLKNPPQWSLFCTRVGMHKWAGFWATLCGVVKEGGTQ